MLLLQTIYIAPYAVVKYEQPYQNIIINNENLPFNKPNELEYIYKTKPKQNKKKMQNFAHTSIKFAVFKI